MREIKFRAWDNENSVIIQWEKMMFDKGINEDEICFFEDVFGDGSSFAGGADIEVMQYTGLKDKNGTEIYEGDILQPSNREKKYYRVVFENGCFEREYKFIQKYEGEEWLETRLFPIHARGHIVAGNIHQHPELLNN